MTASRAILLIDDDEMAREVLSRLLERALPNTEVSCAPHAEAGLTIYQERRPDLVITDRRMLGMSGAELVAAIRQQDTTTPIIVISGASDAPPVPGATQTVPKIEFALLIDHAKRLIETLPAKPSKPAA